jgi:flagellar hook assembly protein FlgD
MKKITQHINSSLLVIVLLFITSNIFGNDSKPSLKILDSEKKVVTLIADNTKNTPLTISISDNQGVNLLEENIAISGRLSKVYDFSELPKGTYKVKIENLISIRKYIVTTTSTKLTILEITADEIHKPIINSVGDVILLNMLNLNLEDVAIAINNEYGEEVYKEKIENTSAIHKRYDLSKLPKGRYSVMVISKAKVFNLEVNLK